MSGLDLADSTLRHSHVLGLDQTDGPDSLATCQQAGEQGRAEKSRETGHQQCSNANRLLEVFGRNPTPEITTPPHPAATGMVLIRR